MIGMNPCRIPEGRRVHSSQGILCGAGEGQREEQNSIKSREQEFSTGFGTFHPQMATAGISPLLLPKASGCGGMVSSGVQLQAKPSSKKQEKSFTKVLCVEFLRMPLGRAAEKPTFLSPVSIPQKFTEESRRKTHPRQGTNPLQQFQDAGICFATPWPSSTLGAGNS